MGENSYGKGSVQSIIPLKNDGAIRLTVAKYYLPSGKSISEVGVSPDIQINEEGEEFKIKSAARSAIINVGAFKLPLVISGITEASASLIFCKP